MEFTKEQLIQFAMERKELAVQFMALPYAPEAAKKDFAILEIALAALTAKPFMYGIEDCDGMAYFAEHCVSSNPAHLSDELHASDDESGEGSKVVALYRLPMIEEIK